MNPEISILKRRVYAFTADLGIITVSNYFFTASMTKFIHTVFFHLPMKTQMFLISKMGMMFSITLMSLTFAYFSLFYFMTNGHTMGKSLFGLKVQNADKSELTLQQSMFRALAYFTCAMTGSFLFALSFIRKDQKSLADVFSSSTVVFDMPDEAVVGTEFQLALRAVEDLPEKEFEEEYEENKAA